MVVIAPTTAKATPAPLHWSRLKRPDNNKPIPIPRATRVPAIRAISGALNVRWIIAYLRFLKKCLPVSLFLFGNHGSGNLPHVICSFARAI
jgi:hypothetical protein